MTTCPKCEEDMDMLVLEGGTLVCPSCGGKYVWTNQEKNKFIEVAFSCKACGGWCVVEATLPASEKGKPCPIVTCNLAPFVPSVDRNEDEPSNPTKFEVMS